MPATDPGPTTQTQAARLPYATDAAEPYLVRDADGRCVAKCATAADAKFFAGSANAYFDLYDSLKAMVEATSGMGDAHGMMPSRRQAKAYLFLHGGGEGGGR